MGSFTFLLSSIRILLPSIFTHDAQRNHQCAGTHAHSAASSSDNDDDTVCRRDRSVRTTTCICSETVLKRDSQAGNQVGESFWTMLLAEHGLDEQGVRVVVGSRWSFSNASRSSTKATTHYSWKEYVPRDHYTSTLMRTWLVPGQRVLQRGRTSGRGHKVCST